MEKIDQFKTFVQKKPELISHVSNGNTTWQKLYEIWDLYGENHDVWKDYAAPAVAATAATTAATAAKTANTFGLKEIINNFKNVDMDSVSRGLDGLHRILGAVKEFTNKDTGSTTTGGLSEPYVPRPVRRYFDD